MRLALLSDIHGNLEALTAVLRDIETRQADQLICLGDVVGYGCDPAACLELVTTHCTVTLMGNHEHAVLGHLDEHSLNDLARTSIQWTRDQLKDGPWLKKMALFPLEHRVDSLHLVHASPDQPGEWQYILTPAAAKRSFASGEAWITCFGHTHLPTIFSLSEDGLCRSRFGHDFQPLRENRYLVNVGSVGQPRDDDPRSCYVIYDTATADMYFHRVPYDYTQTQHKMAAVNAPSMLIERLAVGR
ncbi:MAG: metallophosphoesterase family protein [candidate division Zixibacteria bacterium]|nr:metallophosphoesterase family protein [candidate division Zixibacteria bacterium]